MIAVAFQAKEIRMSDEILTVAMATYRDFSGVYFSIQSLRLYHPKVEILVLDNSPEGCQQTKGVTLASGGKYFHRPDLNGTSISRDTLFRLAKTPWVAVIDCHVMFPKGCISNLLNHIRKNLDSRDFLTGPLLNDNLQQVHSHWRPACDNCLWGEWDDDKEKSGRFEPFEIPMQGLGFFCCNKNYWPGFNQFFRGFGGEEGYIHEKYRQRDRKVLCLPGVQWVHRFRGPSDPVPYQVSLKDHTINLLIGHRELGISDQKNIFDHFGSRLTHEEWDSIKREAETIQDVSTKKELRILGVWYTNNAAPEWCLNASLQSISKAVDASKFKVEVTTSAWNTVTDFPFPCKISMSDKQGHGRIIEQINDCINLAANDYDVICFLEHDVLYPHHYFDRIGEAFLSHSDSPVVSNLDYEGMNLTGYLTVKERHEPMHQLSMRKEFALANLERAKKESDQQGMCLLEPQGNRDNWVRLPYYGLQPAVHMNHDHRFTSHGEVCYEAESKGKTIHRYWGEYTDYWKGVVKMSESKPSCGVCQQNAASTPKLNTVYAPLQTVYEENKKTSVDINEHMDFLRDLAGTVDHVTELSNWINGAAIAMLMGNPKMFVAVAHGPKPEWEHFRTAVHGFKTFVGKIGEVDIDQTDLLFIDTVHTAEAKTIELNKYASKVNKYIVLHDTTTFGEKGQDGGAGIMAAVRLFVKNNPEWTVKDHFENNHGLLVLSRLPEDKKSVPGFLTKAFTYAKAMVKHTANGRKSTSEEGIKSRMDLCLVCPSRNYDICGECGCPLAAKTAIASEKCPLNKWLPE
jgi:hypothetical protein